MCGLDTIVLANAEDVDLPRCRSAVDLAADHRLPIRDALILSVAAENGCRLLSSEDLPDGCTWQGVTVLAPFADRPSPVLDDHPGGT